MMNSPTIGKNRMLMKISMVNRQMVCQCHPDGQGRVGDRRSAVASPTNLDSRFPRQYQETAQILPPLPESDVAVSVASDSPTPERSKSRIGEVLHMSRLPTAARVAQSCAALCPVPGLP